MLVKLEGCLVGLVSLIIGFVFFLVCYMRFYRISDWGSSSRSNYLIVPKQLKRDKYWNKVVFKNTLNLSLTYILEELEMLMAYESFLFDCTTGDFLLYGTKCIGC